MIPAGYMAKHVSARPEWLRAEGVIDIDSVSSCISADFAEYIPFWKHNGYWFFDSPQVVQQVAEEQGISLYRTTLFYYEVYELEFDGERWREFRPESSFETDVVVPPTKTLAGFDVVTFSTGTSPECSPLSCNGLADEVETNSHCLLGSLEQARQLLEAGVFDMSEPGPFRIFAVYSVEWPGS